MQISSLEQSHKSTSRNRSNTSKHPKHVP
uniref:Uncharacterized protein n=1 Tax=Arundo donax TaxID=35708 RepID=A0A0A8Y0J4_ARUDO